MSYIKTRWVDDNTIITAAKLNNIETGVEEAHLQNEKTETAFNNIAADVPEGFNTLKKICIAIGNDSNIGQTVDTKVQALAEKADLVDQKSPKVYLDGERKSNFNFIENKVVQDGLIGYDKAQYNLSITNNFANIGSDKFTIIFKMKANTLGYTMAQISYTQDGTYGGWEILGGLQSILVLPDTTFNKLKNAIIFKPNVETYVCVSYDGNRFTLYAYGENSYIDRKIVRTTRALRIGGAGCSGVFSNIITYNRPLTPQEIQHNFSVLNNTPSMNALNAADKKLLLSTDSNQVEMATGRALEKEYTSLLKQHGKEFTSTGSAISITNGIKGKMLSGEINGNTIKNECYNAPNEWNANVVYGEYHKMCDCYSLKPNTKYYILFKTKAAGSDECQGYFMIGGTEQIGSYKTISAANSSTTEYSELKTYPIQITTSETISDYTLKYKRATGSCLISSIMVLDEQSYNIFDKKTDYKGLSSTQAVISNNGQSYPIYEPIIVGKTRILKATKGTQDWVEVGIREERDTTIYDYKLDSLNEDLGSVDTVYDYIDRARKVKVINTKEIVLNGDENWIPAAVDAVVSGYTTCYFGANAKCNNTFGTISDTVGNITSRAQQSEGFYSVDTYHGNAITLRLSNERINNGTLIDFKKWLKANPIRVRYQLDWHIEMPLTDEELYAYDSYKKVILLPFAEDKVALNEDGSGTWTDASDDLILNGSESWRSWASTNTHMGFEHPNANLGIILGRDKLGVRCKELNEYTRNQILDSSMLNMKEGICSDGGTSSIIVCLEKTKVQDLATFKTWLGNNNLTLKILKAIQTVTTIDKSIMPTIQTSDKINTLSVDSPVSPSEFKAVIPVDRLGDLEQRLTELNSVLLSDANANLVYNYIETEYNKNKDKEVDIICQQN